MSQVLPPSEIRRRAMEILVRELGYADAMRFFHEYETGAGNYTQERDQMLPKWTADEIIDRAEHIEAQRKPGNAAT
jgi:hypothetical protein